MSLQHAILTRFNLPSAGREGLIRASPQWLETRFELFERYCLPSVTSQICKDFQWAIYFDPETPDWARSRIADHERQGIYRAIFRETVPKADLLSDLCQIFGSIGGILLTTRLDNDDMIGRSFVERLQGIARLQHDGRTVFNFPYGFICASNSLYRYNDRSNAFASMCEPWDGALTIWHDWHTRLKRYAPVIQIAADPEWVQIIHGRNVSNHVRGWLVDSDEASAEFPHLMSELLPQRGSALLIDRVRFHAIRRPKEGLRRLAHIVTSSSAVKNGLARIRLKQTHPSASQA